MAVQLEGHEVDDELIVMAGAAAVPQSNCKSPVTGVGGGFRRFLQGFKKLV